MMMRASVDSLAKMRQRPRGITVVALLMIVFGLAEIRTGFSHNFFGLTTSRVNIATYLGVALGVCYFIGGLLILTRRKWAAALLGADVVGRVAMVLAGLYSMDSLRQSFAIVVGTGVACFFGVYIAWKWRFFS
jgi:hypothetical protein